MYMKAYMYVHTHIFLASEVSHANANKKAKLKNMLTFE